MTNFRVGVAPNAFKGALDAQAVAEAIAAGLRRSRLVCEIELMPLADGGDGTLAVMLSQAGSIRREISVQNPLGESIQAAYGLLADGQTAVIEMALASGLALVGDRRDALHASSYGTGELMRHAIENGAKRILLGVGGSATTDGGAGCLLALGATLHNAEGQPIAPNGAGLADLAYVAAPSLPDDLAIEVLCDVDNPPIGETGAAAIFAPQKGASPDQVAILEANLRHYFTLIADQLGVDVRELAGGGAAGAIAGGLAALTGAKLVPGALSIIDALGYAERLKTCDLIITGEGALDSQTERGKAPAAIAALAAAHGIPTIAIAGAIPTEPQANLGDIAAAFSLLPRPADLQSAMQHSAAWLAATAEQLANLIAALR